MTEEEKKAKREKRSDRLIFLFIGVMALLMIGAIAFVIYVCCGGATSGCNCGKC